MVCLGGRAAEELVFEQQTTGASSDLQRATQLVRSMVCDFGMSDLGSATYSQERDAFGYSQKTAELIDKEVQKLLAGSYKDTLKKLKDNKDKLEKLALKLLEKETLYAGEVYELLDITPREDHKLI